MKHDEYHLYTTKSRGFEPVYVHVDEETVAEIEKAVQAAVVLAQDDWDPTLEKNVGDGYHRIRVTDDRIEMGVYGYEGWEPQANFKSGHEFVDNVYLDSMYFYQLNSDFSDCATYDSVTTVLDSVIEREHWDLFYDRLEEYAENADGYDISVVENAEEHIESN